MIALEMRNCAPMINSLSAASTGGHQTLTMIPGSKLWGRVASAFYNDGQMNTYMAVHSGAVRFSPGFPVTETGVPAFPLPQSFREPKHGRGGIVDNRLTGEVWNLAHEAATEIRCAGEALKGWYLAADGSVVRPKTGGRGKTANTVGERMHEPSAYFQYQHLSAGQEWVAWIDGDPALSERAADILSAGVVRLGRSSQKEFGGDLRVAKGQLVDPRAQQWGDVAEGRVVIWCLTDMAIVDAYGTPQLAPGLADLVGDGFEGSLDVGLSSILSRRYAPFNDYLRTIEREHAVIEAGSVLVYQLKTPLPLDRFREGVGLWRERGLGMVWPNPPMLMEPRPVGAIQAAPEATMAEHGKESKLASHDLLQVELDLEDRRVLERVKSANSERRQARKVDEIAERLFRRFDAALKSGKRRGEALPSAAQWSQLARSAELERDAARLSKEILDPENGMCAGQRNHEWLALQKVLSAVLADPDCSTAAFAKTCWRLRAIWGNHNGA